jgi:hypothetical protein
LTKLRWRGGTLDFSKNERIEPQPEPTNTHENANSSEQKSEVVAQKPERLSAIVVPEPPAFVINWRLWGTYVALLLTCIAGVTIALRSGNHSATRSVDLQLQDHDGQLEIRWDPRSDLIRQTAAAKLLILDGAERLIVSLDPEQLQRGTAIYARRSGDVEVRMAVPKRDGKIAEETAIFHGGRAPDAVRTTLTAALKQQAPLAPQPTAMTTGPESQSNAPAPAQPPATAKIARPSAAKRLKAAPVERAARKPLAQSGTSLPFTCSTGDVFHKIDAPPGWDTFTCRGKNLWSIVKTASP